MVDSKVLLPAPVDLRPDFYGAYKVWKQLNSEGQSQKLTLRPTPNAGSNRPRKRSE